MSRSKLEEAARKATATQAAAFRGSMDAAVREAKRRADVQLQEAGRKAVARREREAAREILATRDEILRNSDLMPPAA